MPVNFSITEEVMDDKALGFMREARAALLEDRDSGGNSRELSVALTEIDTAILWRQQDLQMKRPIVNETGCSCLRDHPDYCQTHAA